MVRLPLIRVAHPSQDECEKEVEKIQSKLDPKGSLRNSKD